MATDEKQGPPHGYTYRDSRNRWRCRYCGKIGDGYSLPTGPCPKTPAGTLSPAEQLSEWVAGKPSCPNSMGECCPDFSCCTQLVPWTREEKEEYVRKTQLPRDETGRLVIDDGGPAPRSDG